MSYSALVVGRGLLLAAGSLVSRECYAERHSESGAENWNQEEKVEEKDQAVHLVENGE